MASKIGSTVNPLVQIIDELKRQANELNDMTPSLSELGSDTDTVIALRDNLIAQGNLAVTKITTISSTISPTVVNTNYTYTNNNGENIGSRIEYKRGMNTILVGKNIVVNPDFFLYLNQKIINKLLKHRENLIHKQNIQ